MGQELLVEDREVEPASVVFDGKIDILRKRGQLVYDFPDVDDTGAYFRRKGDKPF